jgi:recombination protein RecT
MTSELVEATAIAVPDKAKTIADWFATYRGEIETQLGKSLDTDAFIRAALSSIRQTPQLQKAEYASVLGSVMLAAQLHLEIGPALGHFYLTPRNVKRGDEYHIECVPIIGYRGYCELAYRTGRIDGIGAFLHREGDEFTMGGNSERGKFYDWKPLDVYENRDPLGVIAYATIKGADRTIWTYLPRDVIELRRPSHWAKTPWGQSSTVEQMWLKTGVRDLAKFLPMSTDLGRALGADECRVERLDGISELVVEEPNTDLEDSEA